MPGAQNWREMVAGFTVAALVAGTAVAQDLPSPSYGFSAVPETVPAARESVAAAPPGCQQATCNEGSMWERYQLRRWERKRQKQHAYLGYPEEFCEQPLGMALYGQLNTQIANGIAAKLALYQFDFVDGGSQLNWRGQQQLAKHAMAMNGNLLPLVIEQTPDEPELDEARRVAVQQALSQSRHQIGSDRVVVGIPTAVALPGQQAIGLNGNLVRDTQAGGPAKLQPGSFRAGGDIGGTAGGSGGGSGSSTGTGGSR